MTKSGLADSPFFVQPTTEPVASSPISETSSMEEIPSTQKPNEKKREVSKQSSNNAGMLASMHENNVAWLQENMLQLIRRAVKDLGKEATTYRFTPEEKKALMEITYEFKVSGFKTSENEVARIAINFIVEEHKENGDNSILEKVLNALKE